ncbi:MAG: hypothetical protein IPG45_15595 [Deltaproteobacteria bacterium]|jgi:hypothetical protein|nr:hypothetical protein [Deltaproteobacteria bacterium]
MAVATSFFALFLASSPSGVEETVQLRLGPCVVEPDLVHDLVGIELGLLRLVDVDGRRVVEVECRAPVLVVKVRPNPEGLLDRLVLAEDLGADGGARLLALNIVELVQEAEARATPPAPTQKPPAPSITGTPRPPEPDGFGLRLVVSPQLLIRAGPTGPAYGLKVAAGLDATAQAAWPWSAAIDLGVDRSARELSQGNLVIETLRAGGWLGLALPLGSQLLLHTHLGLRFGWSQVAAESLDAGIIAQTGEGWWWGPALATRLRFGHFPAVSVGVEAGWIARPIYGQIAEGQAGVRDGWLAVDLGLELAWGAE